MNTEDLKALLQIAEALLTPLNTLSGREAIVGGLHFHKRGIGGATPQWLCCAEDREGEGTTPSEAFREVASLLHSEAKETLGRANAYFRALQDLEDQALEPSWLRGILLDALSDADPARVEEVEKAMEWVRHKLP